MESFWIIVGIAILLSVVLSPLFLIGLFSRLRELEREVQTLRKSVKELESAPKPEKSAPLKTSTPAALQKADTPSEPPAITTPPQSTSPEEKTSSELAQQASQPKAAQRTVQPAERETKPVAPRKAKPPLDWQALLSKIGMYPPANGDSSLMAWWSTRIGLALGIIAAVFMGVYVNQDTNALMRLCQLSGAAVLVILGGLWLERKYRSFGQAVFFGGLSLLYVAAYASYGLPAMKVTDSALIGFWAQVLALGGIAVVAGLRRSEQAMNLALILGYVTSWFALSEGIAPMPYLSLVTLALLGLGTYIMRRWVGAFWIALIGSAAGLALYTSQEMQGIPEEDSILGFTVLVTSWLLSAGYLAGLLKHLQHGEDHHPWLPVLPSIVFGCWLAVGLYASSLLPDVMQWSYASFALLAVVASLCWKVYGESPRVALGFLVKASGLLILCLITWLDGPVRAFGLLGQSVGLLFLARQEKSKILEAITAGVWALGMSYMIEEQPLSQEGDYWSLAQWLSIGFLVGSLTLVGLHQWLYRVRSWDPQSFLQALALAVIATRLMKIEVDGAWGFGLPAFIGLGFILATARLRLRPLLVFPLMIVVLFPLFGMDTREWEGVLLWLVTSLALISWLILGRLPQQPSTERTIILWIAHLLLAGTVAAWHSLALLWLPTHWQGVVPLALSLSWILLARWMPYLSTTAVVPAIWAWLLLLDDVRRLPVIVLVTILALSALAYLWSWRGLRTYHSTIATYWRRSAQCVRTLMLITPCLIIFSAKSSHLGLSREWLCIILIFVALGASSMGRWLREHSMAYGGLAALALATWLAWDFRTGFGVGVTGLLLLATLAKGLLLTHSSDQRALYHPSCASLLYGGLSLVIIALGWTQNATCAPYLTALWCLGSVLTVVAGFGGHLRGYRIIGLVGLSLALGRLFLIDMDETFWRIIGFGVSSLLFIALGYIYNRFHQRLALGDLDWKSTQKQS